eukprot:jgi/Galph1/5241/GphlegSOOS_G3884.1
MTGDIFYATQGNVRTTNKYKVKELKRSFNNMYLLNGVVCKSARLRASNKSPTEENSPSSDDNPTEADVFKFRNPPQNINKNKSSAENNANRVLNLWSSEKGFLLGLVFILLLMIYYIYEYWKQYYAHN